MKQIYFFILIIIFIFIFNLFSSQNFKENMKITKKTAIVYILDNSVGFYSQFFFLCYACIYAEKNNYQFFIDSSNWNYKSSLGWHDYFNSLIEVTDTIKNEYNIIFYDHKIIFNSNIKLEEYTTNDYIQVINKIYILHDYIINKANDYINNVIKSAYISIYIRRGDKLISEAKYIDVKDITKNININNSTYLFIQTDDFNVIKELQILYPNNKIFYIVPETSNGSSYGSSYNKDIDNRNHTEELLIGTYICTNSIESWTDITSNVSRFIILKQKNNINIYPNNIKIDYNKKISPLLSL